jgi:anti-sigma-K factor RskA
MNCDEVRELLPAYVLGALDAADLEAVESHLREGSEHDDELVELRATVFALDRFADEASLDAMDTRLERPSPIGRETRRPVWRMALAAAVLLAVFGAGWLASTLIGGDDGQTVSIAIQGVDGEQLALRGADSDGAVNVTMAGFDRLPEGEGYQIWAIRGGRWLRIGICNTDPQGWWHGDFEFTIRSGEQIAVTIEPADGSETPTSEPILATSF